MGSAYKVALLCGVCATLWLLAPPVGAASSATAVDATAVNPAGDAPSGPDSAPTDELMAQARAHYKNLEFDALLPLVEVVIARVQTSAEVRMDAYLLQGSALAVIGEPVAAEKPFRFLLRGRPDFDLPLETSPKIVAVFRKVQVEEQAIRSQTQALQRRQTLSEMAVAGEPPTDAVGGVPLTFSFRIRDPKGLVDAVRVEYRRGGEPQYSALALRRDEEGAWIGDLPGEWTESADGFVLEYWVATADAQGRSLITRGSDGAPLSTAIAAGHVADQRSLFASAWFWSAVGAGVLALGAAGAVTAYALTRPPESDLPLLQLD